MTEETAPKLPSLRFWSKAFGAVLIVLLLLAAAYAYLGRKGLSRLRAELVAQGEILDWRQLGTNAAPHQTNGMPDIIVAAEALPEMPSGLPLTPQIRTGVRVDVLQIEHYPAVVHRWDGTNINRNWVSNLWTELGSSVDPHRHVWQQGVDATTNAIILHESDWAKGHAMRQFSHSRLKPLGNWSRAAIAYDLQRGAHAQAMETATNSLRVAHRTEGVPTVLGELVRHAHLSIIDPAIWWLLRHPWPDEDLANLQHSLETIRILEPALRAIELERAQTIQAWEKLIGDPVHAVQLLGVGGRGSVLHDFGEVFGLRLWQLGPAHHDLGWYLQRFQIELEACREATRKKSFRLLHDRIMPAPKPPWIYLMSRHLYGSQEIFFRMTFRNQTRLQITITAVALHRFRARHGQFPESLTELVPDLLDEVPADWMNGKSLRYQRKTPDEFRLWSVGKDGIDQGGDPHPPKGIAIWWLNGRDYVWPMAATPEETRKYGERNRAKWKAATTKP